MSCDPACTTLLTARMRTRRGLPSQSAFLLNASESDVTEGHYRDGPPLRFNRKIRDTPRLSGELTPFFLIAGGVTG